VSPAADVQPLVESGVGDMIPHIIFHLFESAAQDVEKMRVAVLAGDPEGLAVAAHCVKGGLP